MFTGIIEDRGTVVDMAKGGRGYRLEVSSSRIAPEARPGDSIAVNGVCLTLTGSEGSILRFDLLERTMSRSNIRELSKGGRVNLERALRAGDRISGHFVTGHVDGPGTVLSMKRQGPDIRMDIRVGDEIIPYLAPRCSLAVDGVSLTVADINGDTVSIHLIPFTLNDTTLGSRKAGERVNIEADILSKYARNRTEGPASSITGELLEKHGFV